MLLSLREVKQEVGCSCFSHDLLVGEFVGLVMS